MLRFHATRLIKRRIRDHFTQHWYANICNSFKLSYYCQFKTEFKMKKYNEYTSNDKLRTELATLRLSAHNLGIEKRRHINVPRENRVCRLCSMSMVESVCPQYNDIEESFYPGLLGHLWLNLFLLYLQIPKYFFLNCQNSLYLQTP